ncbi:hypothetical protein [Nonomuraea sp. B19D2]|uniref:hypothetical protein n=1 Tax=Nonomuraea sp. B19D2 TaxID=3159561 RepID=UPI0032DB4044
MFGPVLGGCGPGVDQDEERRKNKPVRAEAGLVVIGFVRGRRKKGGPPATASPLLCES